MLIAANYNNYVAKKQSLENVYKVCQYGFTINK